MDFLEDYYMFERAMDNAYEIVTRKKTIRDVIEGLPDKGEFALPFDPSKEDGRSPDVLDMLIEHFEKTEEFEKCAELNRIKSQCQKN